jgi:hypothetical protein
MATAKTKGKSSGELSTGGLNRSMKMVKMVYAKCKTCNPHGQGRRGWWENCTHEPYFSMQPEGPPTPEYEEQEDGTYVQVGMKQARYVKRPNWLQVADDVKNASGRMVQIQKERGSKFPEDLGYEPLCDYLNCWEGATIYAKRQVTHEGVTNVIGKYHSRDEAAIMTLRLEGVPIFLGYDSDIARRRKQLDDTTI